jgi:dTDP-4-amino-4,6-dideoxygalactose transaminase
MTTGEGGMVTTDNSEYADAIRSIRNHGERREYNSIRIGHNYRMPEIAAAIGRPQLLKLPKFLALRRRNAGIYLDKLSDLKELQMPIVPEGYEHSWYVFTIRLMRANSAKRNKVVKKIRQRHIDSQVYYSKPIHWLSYYRQTYDAIKLPKTETASRQVFSLPVHPSVSEKKILYIVNVLKKIFS